MQPEFWHERWQTQTIGFHQDKVHPDLECFSPRGQDGRVCRILVPLCGKSWDVPHLAASGHQVVGVELSPLAAKAMIQEHKLQVQESQRGPFQIFHNDSLELRVGNVFDLDASEDFDAVWDRAALVALNPEQRVRYAALLTKLLRPGGQMLLNVFEYDQDKMSGPPHSVPLDEVKTHYAEHFEIEVLREDDILEQSPKFRERGLDRLLGRLIHLTRR
ncbi:MAG: thiopurine S-methyltransferase [Myxococcota bacterium]|nr:thiopurine S-methyltransferase [Myxococcota bacterium]